MCNTFVKCLFRCHTAAWQPLCVVLKHAELETGFDSAIYGFTFGL